MSHTKTNQTHSLYNSTNAFIVRNGMEEPGGGGAGL